jgi:hypothetical protein
MPTPPHYTPISADAQPLAEKLHNMVEPVLNHSRPPFRMPAVNSFDLVSADFLLLARGIQMQSVVDAGTGSNLMPGSPVFVDAPFGIVDWTAPIARNYWIETVLSLAVTAIAPALVRIQLVVSGDTFDSPEAKRVCTTTVQQQFRFIVPCFLAEGPATFSWRWKGPAGVTLAAGVNDMRALRVWA